MTLVLGGLSESFEVEAKNTLNAINATTFYTGPDTTGPFMGAGPLLANTVDKVAAAVSGPHHAEPVLFRTLTVNDAKKQTVAAFGVLPGHLGDPIPDQGQRLSGKPGEAIVDQRLGYKPGESFVLAGSKLTVVGTLDNATLLGGSPTAFMSLHDMQQAGYGGAPIITAVASDAPAVPIEGLTSWDRSDSAQDLVRPLRAARDTITFISVLLWAVAMCIIGSVAYLSAVERSRDFAVFKATGIPTREIVAGLLIQASITAAIAATIGGIIAVSLTPVVPMPIVISPRSLLTLPLIAIAAGMLASLAAARRAVKADPALAFG